MKDNDWYLSSAAGPMFRALPVNPMGQAVVVANADPLAQVSIRVDAPPANAPAPIGVPPSIDVWTFPETAGAVTFTPAVGDPLAVEVVDPRQVDGIDITIQVAGFAGGPLDLMDQTSYGLVNWQRRQDRVDPRVLGAFVGGDRLCSAPSYSWFQGKGYSTTITFQVSDVAQL